MIVYINYKRLKGIATECTADVVTWNPRFIEKHGIGRMRVHIVTEDKNDLSKHHELFGRIIRAK